jgi:hypothetical protein
MAPVQNPIATRLKFPQLWTGVINAGATTTPQILLTAGASGSKLLGVLLNSTDSVARAITISANTGAANFPITTITVPAGAGNGTINSVSVFNQSGPGGLNGMLPVDNDGQQFLFVPFSNTILFATGVTLTAATFIYGIGVGADF